MILADENIDHSLIEAIRSAGIDVISIYETNRGIRDEQVIDTSRNPPQIILTEDKDFGEWVFAHGIQDISVVLLRYSFQETATIKHILIDLFTRRHHELRGSFTTVTINKIRIRPLLL
jgi:predicted nuclease of predicted toxin-antitoxin system